MITLHALATAHPRSRGEHILHLIPRLTAHGSSPLARGTYLPTGVRGVQGRLIPARAGNIVYRPAYHVPYSAHPRSRGEHTCTSRWSRTVTGSSPLARGTCRCFPRFRLRRRLIPARAGNIRSTETWFTCSPAHPRSRGEHRPATHSALRAAGSSPLARGTFDTLLLTQWLARLIPARAGNILLLARRIGVRSAHPRSRGEHLGDARGEMVHSGSSPLARGT